MVDLEFAALCSLYASRPHPLCRFFDQDRPTIAHFGQIRKRLVWGFKRCGKQREIHSLSAHYFNPHTHNRCTLLQGLFLLQP